MAERVVSPGVFTNEIDVSFLPAAVSEIGAALVGICSKGPAYVPTVVESYTDFQIQFGGTDPSTFLPYTAKSYLRNAGTATIVRVLGTGGYTNTDAVVLTGAGTTGAPVTSSFIISSSFSFFHQTGSLGASIKPSAIGSNLAHGRFHTGSVSEGYTTTDHLMTGHDFRITGSNGQVYVFEPWSGSGNFHTDGPGQFGIGELALASTDYYKGVVIGDYAEGEAVHATDEVYNSGNTYFWKIGGNITQSLVNVVAAINAGYSIHGVSASIGGATLAHSTDAGQNSWMAVNNATNYAADEMHNNMAFPGGADWGAIVELTGSTGIGMNLDNITFSQSADANNLGGYVPHSHTSGVDSGSGIFRGGINATDKSAVAVLFPTSSATADKLTGTTISGVSGNAKAAAFTLSWHGLNDGPAHMGSPTMSLNPSDPNYIEDVLGNKPTNNHGHPAYVYKVFKNSAKALAADATTAVGIQTATTTIGSYAPAQSPIIVSQTGSNGAGTDLFRFETLSDGTSANTELKIGIQNVKKAGSIAGSDYGSFDVVVRKFADTDKRPEVLESFTGLNLDKDSSNYFVRKIGDYKKSFSDGKVNVTGDYPNKSKYVRIASDNFNQAIKNKTLGKNLVPFGFGTYKYPFNTGNSSETPVTLPLRLNQSESGDYNSKLFNGLAFDSGSSDITLGSGYNSDILPYLSPIPSTTQAFMTSSAFGLEQCGHTIDSGLAHKKFIMGLQGGNDGFDETQVSLGPSSDGTSYGLGKADPANITADTTAFKNAIDTLSNPDEIDINMLVLPGINSSDHSSIHVKARDMVEDRSDTFYVFDAGNYNATNADVISQVETEDSNYSATYWPWIKIFDDENNSHVWVPPSTVVPGVIAFTDKVSHPWFAPAGLNRGGIGEAIMAKERLTHSQRDDLYEGRVNPIATFPGEGVCIWGQKTLQAKPSALDRVNVRRLLITVKKFIASSSRFLVFEQNTNATRNRFLNIVNPYMEQVQSNSGLSAFRVVMDDTNNTPDVVDRNELRGQIFVQPTRTAEFIVLDFIVQPSGATFPE